MSTVEQRGPKIEGNYLAMNKIAAHGRAQEPKRAHRIDLDSHLAKTTHGQAIALEITHKIENLDSYLSMTKIDTHGGAIDELEKLCSQGQYYGSELIANKINDLLVKHKQLLCNTTGMGGAPLRLLYSINQELGFFRYVEIAYLLANVPRLESPGGLDRKKNHNIRVALIALQKVFPEEYQLLDSHSYQNHKYKAHKSVDPDELKRVEAIWKEEGFKETLAKEYHNNHFVMLRETLITLILEDLKAHPSDSHPGHRLKVQLKKEAENTAKPHHSSDKSGHSSSSKSSSATTSSGVFTKFLKSIFKSHSDSSKCSFSADSAHVASLSIHSSTSSDRSKSPSASRKSSDSSDIPHSLSVSSNTHSIRSKSPSVSSNAPSDRSKSPSVSRKTSVDSSF